MSIDAAEPAPGLIGRVKRLIWDPPVAWEAIGHETPGGVLGKHVAPLALLMAVCGFLGALIGADFVFDGETLIAQPIAAVLRFVLALAGVTLLAKVTEMLSARFGAAPEPGRAMQLAGYGATAFLLAGIGMLLPAVAPYVLAAGGVYSLALIFIGLPPMTGVQEEKRIGYFWSVLAAFALAALVALYAFGAAVDAVRGFSQHMKFGQAAEAPAEAAPARLTQLDPASLRALSDGAAASGVSAEALEGFLPSSLPGGFQRISAARAPPPGGAQAEAAYARGEARLTITITHLGQRGALAATDAAMRGLTVRQDAQGYARHQMTQGRLVAEDVSAEGVRYTIIGRSLAVSIAGSSGATMDEARAAIETIGVTRLENAFPR